MRKPISFTPPAPWHGRSPCVSAKEAGKSSAWGIPGLHRLLQLPFIRAKNGDLREAFIEETSRRSPPRSPVQPRRSGTGSLIHLPLCLLSAGNFEVVPRQEKRMSPFTRWRHCSFLSKSIRCTSSFGWVICGSLLTKIATRSTLLSPSNSWSRSLPVAPVAPISNAFIFPLFKCWVGHEIRLTRHFRETSFDPILLGLLKTIPARGYEVPVDEPFLRKRFAAEEVDLSCWGSSRTRRGDCPARSAASRSETVVLDVHLPSRMGGRSRRRAHRPVKCLRLVAFQFDQVEGAVYRYR